MRKPLPLLLLACTACGNNVDEGEQALLDRQAVAAVEAANAIEPALVEVVPDPILYPDIERHDLYGASCAYAPGTSLGARVIAREVDAYMKIDGEMVRFAADPGSRELAYGTRSLYNGREYSLRLELHDEGEQSGIETMAYEGTVSLRDRYDRVVYRGSGTTQCGV